MFTHTRTRALAAVGTAVAIGLPAALLVAAPAHADVDRRGTCGGGVYELSVDREAGGYEVSVDLDRVATTSRWTITMRQDGSRYFRGTRHADHEGDVDVERLRPNTAGGDVFTFRAKKVGGTATCSAKIRMP